MRRLLPLVVTTLVALVLTGCGSAPSRTGAAAIVGDHVVTIDEIQHQLRTSAPDLRNAVDAQAAQQGGAPGQAVPPQLLAAESRRLLTVSVLHELIGEQSRRSGITVPPAQVDAVLAREGGLQTAAARNGYDPQTLQRLVTDQLTAAAIGRQAFDRLQVEVSYATAPNRATAQALADRVVAAPERASALFASLPRGVAEADLRLRPAAGPNGRPAPSSVLFGLPAGTVAITSSASSASGSAPTDPATGPWTVILVSNRSFDAPPPGPGVARADQLDDDSMFGMGLRVLQPLALETNVEVSPRYGAWDPTQLDVVDGPAAAGTVTPVRGPTPRP